MVQTWSVEGQQGLFLCFCFSFVLVENDTQRSSWCIKLCWVLAFTTRGQSCFCFPFFSIYFRLEKNTKFILPWLHQFWFCCCCFFNLYLLFSPVDEILERLSKTMWKMHDCMFIQTAAPLGSPVPPSPPHPWLCCLLVYLEWFVL